MSAKKSIPKKVAAKVAPFSQGARTDAAKLRVLRQKLKQVHDTNQALAESSKKMLRLFT